MEKQFVGELQEKQTVDSYFLVREKNLGIGRNGKPYMSVQLTDKTGSIDGRVWDRVEEMSSGFGIGDIVKVKGQVQLYQSRKQLVVQKLEKIESDEMSLDEFIPETSKNPKDLFVELSQIVKTIKNDHLRTLIQDCLEDPEIKPLMLKIPAAKTIHHARKGGLLEHILSICKIMEFLAVHYPFLNRDFLLFGAIFHDIGKLWELSFEQGIQYTDRGRLLGHMQIACELIDKKTSRIFGFSEELRDLCKHIVLSHHGKLEYGSPKRPKFLEAVVVSMIDELDSRVDSIHSLIVSERSTSEKWSRYYESYERFFLLDDLKEKFEK